MIITYYYYLLFPKYMDNYETLSFYHLFFFRIAIATSATDCIQVTQVRHQQLLGPQLLRSIHLRSAKRINDAPRDPVALKLGPGKGHFIGKDEDLSFYGGDSPDILN